MLQKMLMRDTYQREPALAVKEMFIYLHKKHKSIVPKLSKALESMKKDGSYQSMVKKHLSSLIN